MNPEHTRLRQQERTEQDLARASAAQNGLEFATVEDLLRHDAEQNPVPGEVAERLAESIAAEPQPDRSLRGILTRWRGNKE